MNRLHLIGWLLGMATLLLTGAAVLAEKKHPAEEKRVKSLQHDFETSLKFVNKSSKTVKVYWLDYDGERVLYKTLEADAEYTQEKTYLTHPWLVTDEEDNAWALYYPDAQPRTVEITAPKEK
jgi:hypothetical protein